jgi:chromate reductase
MTKILAFAGSLRTHSFNKRVLNIAVAGAQAAGAEVTVLDLNDIPMPVYNADVHDTEGCDPNGLRFQEMLYVHDGFLVASPEYNGSVPGGLKNAIDWASRPSEKFKTNEVFAGKTVAMMTASPGSFGGLRCLQHLRGIFTIMGCWVLPAEIAVPLVSQKFDGDGTEMTDEKMRSVLQKHGTALVDALNRRAEDE